MNTKEEAIVSTLFLTAIQALCVIAASILVRLYAQLHVQKDREKKLASSNAIRLKKSCMRDLVVVSIRKALPLDFRKNCS